MSGVFLTEEEIAKVKRLLDPEDGVQAQLNSALMQLNQAKQDLKDLENEFEIHGHYSLREFIE